MNLIETTVFVAATLGLLVFTWQFSVKAGRYHGIYRFVAFECILVLALWNWRVWFVELLSWYQCVSWVLLVGSIVPAVEGSRLLRSVGKPDGQFEATTHLVTEGIYKYVRHPLYGSLVLLCLGVFFKRPSWLGAVLVVVNNLAIAATAKKEEKEMLDKFGSEYLAYMQHSTMFIPFII